ncbi:MAG: RecX family transcriptional regulator [Lactobacillales bacterium]|jgi:regulatory protein|nr:RecX family transcriptional regulator [Lactobacillales bacterium]
MKETNKQISITSIIKEKQDYRIILDNGEKVAVTEDILIFFNLFKGLKISEEKFQNIKKATSISLGLQLAYAYLKNQLRTKKEIQEYLQRQKILDKSLEKILKKLQNLHLVDDKNYAESYIRTKVRLNKKGPQIIKQSLLKKGVSENIIDSALSNFFPNNLQKNHASNLAKKLEKKYQSKSYKEKLQKIYQGLIVQGFNSNIAKDAIENLELIKDEEREWEQLQKAGEKIWQKTSRFETGKRWQKIKRGLYQKGFSIENIDRFVEMLKTKDLE